MNQASGQVCDGSKEALRRDHVYYEGNHIHLMEMRQSLKTNFRKGRMKKIFYQLKISSNFGRGSNYAWWQKKQCFTFYIAPKYLHVDICIECKWINVLWLTINDVNWKIEPFFPLRTPSSKDTFAALVLIPSNFETWLSLTHSSKTRPNIQCYWIVVQHQQRNKYTWWKQHQITWWK